ncbi:alpha/beta hydrolase [Georgenia faecalis]|uniref:alpha/beta hydrolase n=1 Tax=Georgenia faecalis TaxID=2483799 RepID=UPI0013DF88CF|nr:alpha/beta hydrolase-fold protein [Georgenia faecalis]
MDATTTTDDARTTADDPGRQRPGRLQGRRRHHVHRDALASWWTAVGLAAVALAALVASWRRHHPHPAPNAQAPHPAPDHPTAARHDVGRARRRWSRRRRWIVRGAGAVALLGAAGIAVNTHVGFVPDVEGLRLRLRLGSGRSVVPQPTAPANRSSGAGLAAISPDPPQGRGSAGAVQVPAPTDLRIPSDTAWVYTPPGYDPSGRTLYPTLYVLHGSPGSAVDWMASGLPGVLDSLITSGVVRPMIVVAPDTNAVGTNESSCLDSSTGGSQVETYLTSVVVPWVDTHYPVASHWRYRAIGGMSSGAYGALDQGLRHPELYGTILAILPYDHPGEGGTRQLSTQAEIDAHSPGVYVDTIDLPHPLGVFLDYGELVTDDEEGATARKLAARLRARGVDVLLRSEPGLGHTWTMALVALPHGVEFFEHQMRQAG